MGPSAVIASLLIKLGVDPSDVAKGANEAGGHLRGLTKHANLAAAGAGAIAGDFVASSAQRFIQFDDQMRQVFSILPGISAEAMDKMKAQVRDLSKEYGVATDVVIPGMYDALSSGIDQADIGSFMETAQKMAVAGVADTQQAVNLLAQVKNAYRQNMTEVEATSDQMFMAVNKGVTTIPELSSALSAVTPIASSMGIGINEVLGAITAMTLQGSATSEAVTMIRSSLVALLKPLPPLRKGLEEAGYASGQAAIEALGYQGAMELVRDISEKTGITLPKLTGRIEGTSAVLQLTGENADAARQALDDVSDAAGTTDAAFRIMQGGVGGVARRLQAQIQDLSLSAGEMLAPIAPIFMAFGPQIGRWLGRGIGAGLGLGLKGAGGIIKRALPGLADQMTALGAEAGGNYAKAMGQSIATSIKSAGWKKLALGGLALGAGVGLMSADLEGPLGLLTEGAGAAMTIAGAFAIGGPVMAGIAAIALLVQQIGDFLGKVEKAQADLDDKVAKAGLDEQGLAKTGARAVADMEGYVRHLNEMEGLGRIVADTWGGAQQLEGLQGLTTAIIDAEKLSIVELDRAITTVTAAAHEAAARGNATVQADLLAQAETLRQMRSTAASSASGMWVKAEQTITDEAVEAAAGAAAAGDVVVEAVGRTGAEFREAAAQTASVIGGAWDTITGALSEGPKITSMEQRMKRAGTAINRSLDSLRKAVRRGDVVAAAFYTDQVVSARAARRALRTGADDVFADAKSVLGTARRESGRQHKGMADDATREHRRGGREVRNATRESALNVPRIVRSFLRDTKSAAADTADALPKATSQAKPKVAAAAQGNAAAVTAALAPLPAMAHATGTGIGAMLAAGMVAQTAVVAAASAALAAAAAGPIETHSPPKVGPLRGIRSWGPALVDTWLGPMLRRLPDVERVGDALGRAVTPRAALDGLGDVRAVDRLSAAGIRGGRGISEGMGSGEVHYHFHGPVIADDRGIDTLDERINRRRRHRTRGGGRRLNDPN